VGDPTGLFALAHASGHLSVDGFARLAALGERRSFAAGERLMKQGTEAASMFVILAGKVSVVREHPDLATPIPLAFLGPGEVVGEMGLLDGDPRSATVTAVEETVTVEVPGEALAQCVSRYPDVYASLVKVLSKRLRDTNELVAETAKGATSDESPPPA
jgi:CRP-like cAMP-binding protein